MKTTTAKRLLTLLTVSMFIQPFENSAQTPCDYFPDLGEDIIVDDFIKDYSGANLEKQSFTTAIHYSVSGCNSTCTLTNAPTVIQLNALIDLFNKTKNLAADIRGMEVIIGLSGDHTVYYYTALTMTYDPTNSDYKVTRVPDNTNPQIYKYSAGSTTFTPLSTQDMQDFKDRQAEYVNNIRILHLPSDATYGSIYNTDNTWRQDTKSVIFSFQEIFYLSQNCFQCTQTDSRSLYFYNGSWGYYESDNPSEVRNKHNIFISCESMPADSPNYTLVANMAHLCPPSCDPAYETTTWGVYRINTLMKSSGKGVRNKRPIQQKKQ